MTCFILQLVDKKTFKSPKEFREESQWIFHNAIIYFGGIHQMQLMASDKFLTSWNLHCLTYSSSGMYQSFDYILTPFPFFISLFPSFRQSLIFSHICAKNYAFSAGYLLVNMQYFQMLSMKIIWHLWLKFQASQGIAL